MILWGSGEWDVWGGGEWALQWLSLASPREEAGGRIISFLLMSSTSWGGGGITLLLFSSLSPRPLMAVAAATGLTVTYCIRGVTQEPAHRSVLPAFPLSRLYQQRQMPCCKSFHRDEFLIHLFISFSLFFFFFYLAAFLSSDTLTWNHACQSRVQTQVSLFPSVASFLVTFLATWLSLWPLPAARLWQGFLSLLLSRGPSLRMWNYLGLKKTTSSTEKKWNYMFEVMDSLIFLLLSSICALLSKRRKKNKVFLCSCDQWH